MLTSMHFYIFSPLDQGYRHRKRADKCDLYENLKVNYYNSKPAFIFPLNYP